MNTTTRHRALSLILSIIPFCSMLAQWQEVRSIYGKNPLTLIEETTNKLVGITDFKVYTANKTDYFWEEEMEFNMMFIHGMTTKNDTVYVIYSPINDIQIYLKVSFDEGSTWQAPRLVAYSAWGSISAAYMNNQLILAGTLNWENRVLKSSDFGQTWESSVIPNEIEMVNRINDKTDTQILFGVKNASTLDNQTYLYSATDNTWTLIPFQTNSNPRAVTSFILNDRIFTAGINSNSIYSCALDGSDMQTVYTLNTTDYLWGFVKVNERILINKRSSWASPVQEIYMSEDFGQTFEFQSNFNNAPNWGGTKSLGTGELIIFSDSLYLMSQDFSGLSPISLGFLQTGISNFQSINNTLWVSVNGYIAQRSTDNGLSFEPVPSAMGELYGGIAHQGDTLFYISNDASEDLDSPYGYRISLNSGFTSEEVMPIGYAFGVNGNTQQSIIYNNVIYTTLADQLNAFPAFLFKSSDYGETWENTQAPGGLSGNFTTCNNALYFYGQDLYRLDEVNDTWLALNSPISNQESNGLSKLRVLGTNILMWNEDGSLMLYSTSQYTFSPLPTYLHDVAMAGNLAYGISSNALLVSADYGLTWQSTNIPLPTESNFKMASHNGTLYLYGDILSSIWKLDAPQMVNGLVYYDENENGLYDQGEMGIPNIMIQSQNTQTYVMSGPTGAYTINFNGQQDQFIVEVNNSAYTAIPQNFTVSNPGEVYIGIQVQGSIADLSADVIPFSPFRPGFPTSAIVHLANEGNVVQGGILTVQIPENVSLTSSSVQPESQTENNLTFTIANLQAFESRQIQLNMLTSVSAALGDTALLSASLTAGLNDVNLENNTVTDSSIIVGAYDPNDKTCYRGVFVTPAELNENNEFEYLIRFQNTGTFYAENVVIEDTISSYFDLSTLRIIASSDTMNVKFEANNLVKFNFPLIFLPDSNSNEPESHGFVKYAIRTKPNLQLGSVLRNTAYIYFDFNEPIITNTTETVYDLPNNVVALNHEEFIQVYPNPTRYSIHLHEASLNASVIFFDVSGKQVMSTINTSGEVDISALNPGIYLGSVITNNGQLKRFKVVKL